MEMNTDCNIAQILGMGIRRISTDNDSLTHNGGTFANDSPTELAVIGPANLTPFTTALKLSFAPLEKQMVTYGIDLIGTSLESFLTFRRAHELNLKPFLSKQALIPRDKPRQRENSAAGDITGDFPDQCLPPASKVFRILQESVSH